MFSVPVPTYLRFLLTLALNCDILNSLNHDTYGMSNTTDDGSMSLGLIL